MVADWVEFSTGTTHTQLQESAINNSFQQPIDSLVWRSTPKQKLNAAFLAWPWPAGLSST